MVCFNVSQLLLEGPGATRDFEFSEPFPDPANELHMRGPISGHAHLTRTSEGILAHTDFRTCVVLECSRLRRARSESRSKGRWRTQFHAVDRATPRSRAMSLTDQPS